VEKEKRFQMSSYRRGSAGPPAWLIFIIAVAMVFGVYYLWTGFQNYLRTGGLGVVEATERANLIASSTADQIASIPSITPRPSFTPIPECQNFIVSVPSAIVREVPASNGPILTSLSQGTSVCVLGRDEGSEWYTIDNNPETRRLELAYMHETVIEAVNPTPTITLTPTPLPTVTPAPSLTPSITPSPAPTATIDPDATDTPSPTPTPTETPTLTPTESFQSA
jgi:hypothetical protein